MNKILLSSTVAMLLLVGCTEEKKPVAQTTEVAKQTLQLKNITKIGSFVDIVKQNVTTNIKNWSTITDYVTYAVDFNTENIKTRECSRGKTNFCVKHMYF